MGITKEGRQSYKQVSQLLISKIKWPVQSRQLENPLEERLPGSSSLRRLPGSLLLQLEESRSLTDTGLEPSPSVRLEDTRSPLSCSSESCPSSVWGERLPKISKLISGSSQLLLELFRRHLKLTWLDCLRIPTCVPSTPSVSLSCPKISSWPEESVARELNYSILVFMFIWWQFY